MAQLKPVVEPPLGRSQERWLVDGGFPTYEHIDAMAHKTSVYAQVPEPTCALTSADTSTHAQIPANRVNSQALSLGKKTCRRWRRQAGE